MKNLNENELLVLKSLVQQMDECTGGDFGYLPSADRGAFTKHEFSGYVSQLYQKGYFEWLYTSESEGYKGNYAIKKEYFEQLKPQAH